MNIVKTYSAILFVLTMVWVFSPLAAVGQDQTIELHGETITLKVENTPLLAILDALSRQGVAIHVDSAINPQITASFTKAPVEKAFNIILKDYSYSLIWERPPGESKNRLRLAEAHIFKVAREAPIFENPRENLNIVKGKNGVLLVKNSLLLKVSPQLSEQSFKRLIRKLRATILSKNSETGIVRLQLPDGSDVEAIAEILAEEEAVFSAEPDFAYPIAENVRIEDDGFEENDDQRNLRSVSTGAPIAVLDSGLAVEYHSSSFVSGVYDAVGQQTGSGDTVGHGTQMSLIASGAIKPLGAEEDDGENRAVVSIRALDDNGFTSNSILMNSIDHAIATGARVISMSWGSETKSELLEYVTQYAAEKDLILVAAAGNEPSGAPVYPAAFDEVIGVGALEGDGQLWQSSNFGDFVSVYAPGIATVPGENSGEQATYAGTSIATALVANRVSAILQENPDADRNTILQELLSESESNSP